MLFPPKKKEALDVRHELTGHQPERKTNYFSRLQYPLNPAKI
jgi:hypothetical protein